MIHLRDSPFLLIGSQLEIPASVTPVQLETLLNGLLSNEEKLPYSFHIEEQVCSLLLPH